MNNKKKFLALVFALIFVLSVNNKIDTLHKEKETLKKEETMTLKKRKFYFFSFCLIIMIL